MRVIRLVLFASITLAGLCIVNTAAADAEEEQVVLRKHGDWWLGADAGAGAIHLELPQGAISENKFYLGARVEYVLNPKFLLGVEVSGFDINRPIGSKLRRELVQEREVRTERIRRILKSRSKGRGWRLYY